MLIQTETREAIAILRMDNAGENKFTREFIAAFNQALDQVEADAAVRAVVITGTAEKFFSTGLDLTWLMTRPKDDWLSFFLDMDRLLLRVFTFPKPVVAALNGHAFAGGLFLALCADYRVMREDRGFCCMPEIDLGIELPPGTVALISHVLGRRNAELLSLFAKRLAAKDALRVGAVDEIVKAEEVLPRALEAARHLASKNPKAYAQHKLALRKDVARVMREDDPPFLESVMKDKH
jgi:enoyl-CoA hydratase